MSKDLQKGQIKNFYETLPKTYSQKKDPAYPKTLIKKNSMCLVVGGTGAGKTNMISNFLERSSGTFYDITIYTGSSKDEPLYRNLAERIDGLDLIDQPNKLPMVDDHRDDDDKDVPKCLIFDDCIQESKPVLKVIEKWYMCARKLGYTCFFLSQNYHSTPTFIRRNVMYLFLFKQTDMADMKKILSKYCVDIDLDTLKNMLAYATKENLHWLTIAINDPKETRYRKNFDEILNPNDFMAHKNE